MRVNRHGCSSILAMICCHSLPIRSSGNILPPLNIRQCQNTLLVTVRTPWHESIIISHRMPSFPTVYSNSVAILSTSGFLSFCYTHITLDSTEYLLLLWSSLLGLSGLLGWSLLLLSSLLLLNLPIYDPFRVIITRTLEQRL